MSDDSTIYLEIKISGHKGKIEAKITKNLFSYYIKGNDNDAAYVLALDGLIKVYKEL